MNKVAQIRNSLVLPILYIIFFVLPGNAWSQQKTVTIQSIVDSVVRHNPVLKMYDAEIRSMDEAARGARSWMPPDVGAGFFMTPYNTDRWKKMSDMEPGMGNLMISMQQMFPNRKKLNADEAYMQSMSAATTYRKGAALHEIIIKAKQAYYEWVIIQRKSSVLDQNEKVLEFMIKNAEIRYQNGLDKLNAYYKAKAALGNVQKMRIMFGNEANRRRIMLNTLMNRDGDYEFTIDTSITIGDYVYEVDTTTLLRNRSDLKAIDREIATNELRLKAEKLNLKPRFGLRFEHMFAFGNQPQQFNLMGMVTLPMVPWASKMTKANAESYKWRTQALEQQKQMMLNEARGMASETKAEIEAKKKQKTLYENNIIPALRNNYNTMLLAYEQNTEELYMLFDAWETLSMTQIEYLDQVQELIMLTLELEHVLEIGH
jgi:outer membrane protein TolC